MVDNRGCARITDFGFAKDQNAIDEIRITADSTTRWTAPEILKEQGSWSKEADVFSFSMVMVEVR